MEDPVGSVPDTRAAPGEVMGTAVVPLASSQWQVGVAVQARAFYGEPPFTHLFPDEDARAQVLLAWFGLSLRGAASAGHVVETTPAQHAVGLWSPPGLHDTPWQMLRQAPSVMPEIGRLLRRASAGDLRRAVRWGRRIEQRRQELMPHAHWSLDVLAVDPRWQRFGLGAVLVRHGLARADSAGLPVYVETNAERTAAFYRKLGFEVVEHVTADYPPLDIPTWRLVHRPGSGRPDPSPAG